MEVGATGVARRLVDDTGNHFSLTDILHFHLTAVAGNDGIDGFQLGSGLRKQALIASFVVFGLNEEVVFASLLSGQINLLVDEFGFEFFDFLLFSNLGVFLGVVIRPGRFHFGKDKLIPRFDYRKITDTGKELGKGIRRKEKSQGVWTTADVTFADTGEINPG